MIPRPRLMFFLDFSEFQGYLGVLFLLLPHVWLPSMLEAHGLDECLVRQSGSCTFGPIVRLATICVLCLASSSCVRLINVFYQFCSASSAGYDMGAWSHHLILLYPCDAYLLARRLPWRSILLWCQIARELSNALPRKSVSDSSIIAIVSECC